MKYLLPRFAGLLPQHTINHLARALGECRLPWLRKTLIRWFVRRYGVDMSEAAEPDPDAYPCFNAFFTRALRPGARVTAPGMYTAVSPADGILSGFGSLAGGQLLQAKGKYYSLAALLGDAAQAQQFKDGYWATVYLAPRNYHRVHMPLAGRLRSSRHIPGRLFPVNPASAAAVPHLLSRNQRRVCLLEGPAGPFALVFVGALIVGSIRTVWEQNPPPTELAKGAQAGYFCLGSTAVVLFCAPLRMAPALTAGAAVRQGQELGVLMPEELPAER